MKCTICGSENFKYVPVLWNELINEWQLSNDEVKYINRQQGEFCTNCGSNLRTIALANAIRGFVNTDKLLLEILSEISELSILEINEAGNLTKFLKDLPNHILANYPDIDIHKLPYNSGSFDLVIHSDTLEHVANPIHALMECKRVLKPNGALCFTIPIIVNRLTRDRTGMPASYHGSPYLKRDDYKVITEFGSDAWKYLFEAGYSSVTIYTFEYPAGIAFLAR